MHMLRKYQRKVLHGNIENTNYDNISMVKNEYEKFMNARTFSKSIDNLIEHGFIRVIKYGFNDAWKFYGTNIFKIKNEWKRINKH